MSFHFKYIVAALLITGTPSLCKAAPADQITVYGSETKVDFTSEATDKICSDLLDDASKNRVFVNKKPVITILRYRIPGRYWGSRDAEELQDDLQTGLVRSKLARVQPRSDLERILAQLRLEMTDLFDSNNARRFGQLAGSDYILFGSFSVRGRTVVVNSWLLNCQAGEIAPAVKNDFNLGRNR